MLNMDVLKMNGEISTLKYDHFSLIFSCSSYNGCMHYKITQASTKIGIRHRPFSFKTVCVCIMMWLRKMSIGCVSFSRLSKRIRCDPNVPASRLYRINHLNNFHGNSEQHKETSKAKFTHGGKYMLQIQCSCKSIENPHCTAL